MKISFLCSDSAHPVNTYLVDWISRNEADHDITLGRLKSDLPGGDILFLVSCNEIIRATDRAAYRFCLVLHASDLPYGRGWSPHIWEIINGAETITLSLLEAEDKVDTGRIWEKLTFSVPRHALWNEINHSLFQAEIKLIDFAVKHCQSITPSEQSTEIEASYFLRRSPEDSRVDPAASIADQFNLIRVCDPQRFPAFFDLHGRRYKLILEKMDEQLDHD